MMYAGALLEAVRAIAIEHRIGSRNYRVQRTIHEIFGRVIASELHRVIALCNKTRKGGGHFRALLPKEAGGNEAGGSKKAQATTTVARWNFRSSNRCAMNGAILPNVISAMADRRALVSVARNSSYRGRNVPIFRRVTRVEPKGTFLLDASGSMNVTAERLATIAAKLPGATIAYYSGDGGDAQLVIFAQGGRRIGGEIPYSLGGNYCDCEAIEWLLKQEGPRVLVTDEAFDGPRVVQAHSLVAQHKGGSFEVIGSYDELEGRFLQ